MAAEFEHKITERIEPEKQEIKIGPADCIVFFGRGIERVNVLEQDKTKKEKWKPTRLIQELVKNHDKPGYMRTGKRFLGDPRKDFKDNDQIKEMVAGGNANVIAAAELYERLAKDFGAPKEVIISGGRPAYLEKEPSDISEARFMKEMFERKLAFHKLPLPEVSIIEHSKNTEDDLVESLKLALEKGYKQVTVVNASIAIDRTKAFWESSVLPENPDLRQLQVTFIGANDLLSLRMGSRFGKIEKN